jgi:hypothetical protein
MKILTFSKKLLMPLLSSVFIVVTPEMAIAHCDSMDGPVVKAAKKALDTGDVNLVLIWVQKKDEPAIRTAFENTLAVRKLNPQAKELADVYFFETLVRIHRAGEGAPYTGLKPAGTVVEPGIDAADKAVEKGSADELLKNLTDTVQKGIRVHFTHLMEKKNYKKDDVETGREFVGAYVVFIHYVEQLYQSAEKPVEGHYHEAGETSQHKSH